MVKKVKVLVLQLCLTLCNSMDCSPPCSSLHRILQVRTLEWVTISFSHLQCRRCVFDPWVRKILEEGMAIHSRILAWRIPWTEEPEGLQFTGSHRIGHTDVT